MKTRLLLIALVMTAVFAVSVFAACGDPTPPPPDEKAPIKKADIAAVEVDLYGEDGLSGERTVSYPLVDYVDLNGAENVTFTLASGSAGLTVGKVKNNKFDVTVATAGEKSFTLKVLQSGAEKFALTGKITVTDSSEFNIKNASFETGDLTDWTADADSGFSVAENQTYFDFYDPVPTVNQQGDYYLDGFGQADGFADQDKRGSIRSSDFKVGGSRWITFRLGGGNQKTLKMQVFEKGADGDKLVATFNNYKFSDPYRSIGLTEYAYRLDESLMGKTCYVRLTDSVTSGAFPAFTADDFRTYYKTGSEPVIDNENIFAAGYYGDMLAASLDVAHADKQLRNGNFETGDLTGWTAAEAGVFAVSNAETYFEGLVDPVPHYNKEGEYFLSSEADEAAMGSITSTAFKVEGSRWLTFRVGGSRASELNIALMAYDPDGDETMVAQFNNGWFSDPYRSFGMTKYAYRVPAEYEGRLLYFVITDRASANFGAITADDFVTYYPEGSEPVIDDENIFAASYQEAVIGTLDDRLGLDTAGSELRNGGFETGDTTGWFTIDLNDSYSVYGESTFFDALFPLNPPKYGVDGEYFLTGAQFDEGASTAGLNAVGSYYSQAFVAGGTGYITFKMGGTNNEKVALELIRYVENGDDEVVARFNNYLFSDPYRSMGMTTYGYQIDSAYLGQKFYFRAVDRAPDNIPFASFSLDAFRTYYETAPTIYNGVPMALENVEDGKTICDDMNIYPAGYVAGSLSNITEKLGLNDATYNIRNGGFETGDHTGWFTDLSGYGAYAISSASTYFDGIYPDNIPVYNKEGNYFLDGYGAEGYVGKVYSQVFKVGGSRWISFRLGGNKTDNLQLKLMRYVDGQNDEVIATFNNWLFSDPYRSFGMTKYAYRIGEQYTDALCYFVLDDSEVTGGSFNAMTADDFVTFYETAPDVYAGAPEVTITDGRTYRAGYCNAPV